MRTAWRAPITSGCCSRCAALTDQQIQALTHGTISVGPIGYTAQGKIVPVSLAAVLAPREHELLVALLLAHPGVASYEDLADPYWSQVGADEQRAEVRARMGRLNDQILLYGVRAVNRSRQGYHLVELVR